MELIVLLHEAEEGGYWAEIPALDGCYAQGESIEETIEDARGAARSHLDALKDFGEEPAPTRHGILMTSIAV